MKKPSLFGKYLLLERLNVGGMAEVFVAKAFGVEGFERILAIKKILPTMAEDEEFITMFIDEARISVQLNHANVVHIHELGKHDDAYYIAMEYVPGKDLRSLLERFRRRKEIMPTAMAVYCATKICEGLDYAHRKKDARGQELFIIHRDVSPQNILISFEGEVKIIDFGIAKAANRSQKTQAGILKGKFGYMSPEQVRGLPIDRRSDIFAVGVIIYEMLTGEKLFVGESDFSTLEKVRNAEVPAPRQFNPNIPAGLEKVVMKALAREQEERYQWSSDLQEDLMRFLLAGDAIYSGKHLAAFMKDAFAEDVLRENEKMERFASVEKPDSVDAASVSAPLRKPTPAPALPPPRRNTAQPSAAISALSGNNGGGRRQSQNVAVATGSGAVATGLQSSKIEIPPPTEEELAEMDGARDRTVMVALDAQDNANATAVGTSPFSQQQVEPTAPASRQLRPQAPTSGNSATHDNLKAAPQGPRASVKNLKDLPVDETLVPQARSSLIDEDTGNHDLRPIEMTGFRPAMDVGGDARTGETPALSGLDSTVPPKSNAKPKIVIGDDAPLGGATSIGPSPFAKNETRMYEQDGAQDESNAEEAGQDEQQQDDDQNYEQNEGAQADEVEPEQDEEADPTSIPAGQRQALPTKQRPPPPRVRAAAGKTAPADGKRKGLLIAIAATAVLALVVIIAAAVKFAGGPKSAVVIVATPKDVPFSVTINPGQLRVDKPTKAIELEPGEYTLEFKPTSPGYLSAKKSVSLKPGKTAGVTVTFQRSEPEVAVKPPPDAVPDTPPKPPDTKTPDTKTAEVPALWSVVISSAEPGVEIFLDGKSRGVAPLTIKDLAAGKTYEFTAKKSGFETQAFSVSNTDKSGKVEKALSMVKVVAAKQDPPKADPVKNDPPPRKDPVEVARVDPPPKKDPPPKADPPPKKDPPKSKVMGKVAFASKPTGAEVWVDGKNTGKKTPVPQPQAIELSVGKHKVVFKLDGKSSPPQDFEVLDENKDKPKVVKGEI